MDSFIELFGYSFFQNAILAAVFTSISCGIVGAYIVSKRIVFISGGITHASFGGIGMGYFFGFNPIIGAMIFSVMSALGIEFLSKKNRDQGRFGDCYTLVAGNGNWGYFHFPYPRLFSQPDELPFWKYFNGVEIEYLPAGSFEHCAGWYILFYV
jgi:hypothetical protein